MPEGLEIPPSYRHYLGYLVVKARKGNQFMVKTPQGTRVVFEVVENRLKKTKQERAVLTDREIESEEPEAAEAPENVPEPEDKTSSLEEKMQDLERTLVNKLSVVKGKLKSLENSTAESLNQLDVRLESFEKGAAIPQESRISEEDRQQWERRWAELEARVERIRLPEDASGGELARKVGDLEERISEFLAKPREISISRELDQRLNAIEERMGNFRPSEPAVPKELQQRLDSLEERIAGSRPSEPAVPKELQQRLDSLEERIAKSRYSEPALARELKQRLDALEERLAKPQDKAVQPSLSEEADRRLQALEARIDRLQGARTPAFPEERPEFEEADPGECEVRLESGKSAGQRATEILHLSAALGVRFARWLFLSILPLLAGWIDRILRYSLRKWRICLPAFAVLALAGTIWCYSDSWLSWFRAESRTEEESASSPQPGDESSQPADSSLDGEESGEAEKDREPKIFYQGQWYTQSEVDSGMAAAQSANRDSAPNTNENLRNSSSRVRQEAIRDIARQDPSQAGPSIVRALQDEDRGVQSTAIKTLGEIQYRPAIETLAPIAKDRNIAVYLREEAAMALGTIGASPGNLGNATAMATLKQLIQDKAENIHLRATATAALGKMGVSETFRDLFAALEAPEDEIREQAAAALGNLEYPGAAEKLIATAQKAEEAPPVRQAAVRALGKIPLRADQSYRALIEIYQNPDCTASLRRSARESLENLAPKLSPPLREEMEKALK